MTEFGYNIEISALVTSAIKVVLIIVVAFALIWILKRIIHRIITARMPRIREESTEQLASRADTLSKVVNQVFSFIIWIVAAMMILSALGVNIAPILAAVGLAGLAIGFAAQNIIRDYFHGFFIIMEDWFRIGEVAAFAGVSGVIDSMSLRRTVLRDVSGTMHVIPNSKIEIASNMARDWARINLNIAVAYKENLDRVIEVINDVCRKLKEDNAWGSDLISTPEVVRVDNLGDSGIEIKILGDTKPMRQFALTGELRKRLKDRFDQENIEMPWPHSKVYFGNTPTGVEVQA